MCRQRLIYKQGIWINNVRSSKKCTFCMFERKISQSFSTKIGLKQGDVLSTLLFKLYVNDLPGLLNKESNTKEDQLHIPKLENIINSLLFADDLVKV